MGVYRRVLTCKSSITYLALSVPVDGEIQSGYKNGRKRGQNPLESISKGMKKACCKARCTNGLRQLCYFPMQHVDVIANQRIAV